MSSLVLVRSLDPTMRRSTPMDQERFEHSVFGPTRSVSRPSPSDPCQCVHSDPRGPTNCLIGSTAIRLLGLRVATATPTMAGSMNFSRCGASLPQTFKDNMALRSTKRLNGLSTCGLRVAAMAIRPFHDKFSPMRSELAPGERHINSWRTWLSD